MREDCKPWVAFFNKKNWEEEVKRQVAAYPEIKSCEYGCAQQPEDSDHTQAETHDMEVSASSNGRRLWDASTKQKPPQDDDVEKNPAHSRVPEELPAQPAHRDCVHWPSSDSLSATGNSLASENPSRPGSGEEPKDIPELPAEVEVKKHDDDSSHGPFACVVLPGNLFCRER